MRSRSHFLFGQNLLDLLALEQASAPIAGGIVLWIIGLRMVFPTNEGSMGDPGDGEPFIVPLALRLVAGRRRWRRSFSWSETTRTRSAKDCSRF